MSDNVLRFPDLIRVEGVMVKGFGLICKYPMRDVDLDISAKAVYALFCALAGNDHTAFPSREKIKGLLKVGEKKYQAGLKQLREQGYVTVEQTGRGKGRFGTNIYTIVSNPKKFAEDMLTLEGDGGELSFGFTGMKSAGYGMLPRAVMFDSRLDCTAKVIYAYLASYSGAGSVPFPKSEMICRDLGLARGTFFKYMKQLVDTNYITREQRHINGRLASNNYHLNDCPDEAQVSHDHKVVTTVPLQRTKNGATVQRIKYEPTVKEHAVKEHTAKESSVDEHSAEESTAEQHTVGEHTTINNSLKNSSSKITLSINSPRHWTDGMSRKEIKEFIQDDLELEFYTPEVRGLHGITLSDSEIDYFVDIATDFVYSRKPTLVVKGREYTREEVNSRIMSLGLDEYQAIFNQMTKVTTPIRNPQKYILACMVTIREDMEMQASVEVARDFELGVI